MAKITKTPTVNLSLTFTINESEARALDALAGYDHELVVKVFKDHLGSHYIKGHEQGLITFLTDIRGFIPGVLAKLDDARKTFNEQPTVNPQRICPNCGILNKCDCKCDCIANEAYYPTLIDKKSKPYIDEYNSFQEKKSKTY